MSLTLIAFRKFTYFSTVSWYMLIWVSVSLRSTVFFFLCWLTTRSTFLIVELITESQCCVIEPQPKPSQNTQIINYGDFAPPPPPQTANKCVTNLILRAHSLPNGGFSCLHLFGCVSLMKSCLHLFLSVTFAAVVSALCSKTLQKRWLVPRLWPFPYQESLPKSPDHPSMWHLTPVSKRAERVAGNTTSREERYKMAKGLNHVFCWWQRIYSLHEFPKRKGFFI